MRNAVSSWTFAQYAAERAAAGRAIEYVATDITRREPVGALDAAMAGCPGVAYAFREGDDLTIPQWDTDFLFLDTWHTYRQLAKELLRWAPRTRGVLVLHDTRCSAAATRARRATARSPWTRRCLAASRRARWGCWPPSTSFSPRPRARGGGWRSKTHNCNGIMVLVATAPP